MSRDLAGAIRRFEATASNSLSYQGLDWQEFEMFLGSLSNLEETAKSTTPNNTILTILNLLRNARRVLRSSPVSASNLGLGLHTIDWSRYPEAGTFSANLNACHEATGALMASENPAITFLREYKNSNSGLFEPNHTVQLVVPKSAKEILKGTLREIGFDKNVELCTPNELKNGDIVDLAILFGSPEHHGGFHSPWSVRSKEMAWLFNAPASYNTLVLSWPGNEEFRAETYTYWPEAQAIKTKASGPTAFQLKFEFESFGANIQPFISERDRGKESGLVTATAFALPNDNWVFYASNVGPRPNQISNDEFGFTIREVRSTENLEIGNVLVLRTEVAEREFLDKAAADWLDERNWPGFFDSCKKAKDEFRGAIRLLAQTHDSSLDKLQRAGLREDFARHQLAGAWDPNVIATRSQSDYVTIAQIAGLIVTELDWKLVSNLRSAYRQAGHRARSLIQELITTDVNWEDQVNTPEIVLIDGDELGEVKLAPICGISQSINLIPISHLGQLILQNGTLS